MNKLILITGGAGFIGSNIIKQLNDKGHHNILVVDNLSDGKKCLNLTGKKIADYQDKTDFLEALALGVYQNKISAIIHMGACSSTTELDGRYMMRNNYEYSKRLFEFAREQNISFLYASSAAVYGGSETFVETPQHESPLNVYGYSKLLFDEYVRARPSKNQIAGFRFFNVYGPGEQHKGSMASVALHNYKQMLSEGVAKLFGAHGDYAAGEQQRDFVYVDDVAQVVCWFLENPQASGIFNVGTGKAQAFNDIAKAAINFFGTGSIQYIDFPEHLIGAYQSFTQADISALRAIGYNTPFLSVEEGVQEYLSQIHNQT